MHDCGLNVTPGHTGKAADNPAEVFVPEETARSKQARKAPLTDGQSSDGDNTAAEQKMQRGQRGRPRQQRRQRWR